MIAGIILAAGAACRMGRPKQLIPLAGKPMVRHVAEAACLSRLDSVILVTGAYHESVADAVKDLPLTLIHNAAWNKGQASSLTAGLKGIAPDAEAVMFLLADQPLLTTALIDSLIESYWLSGQSIICPCYDVRRGNPVLFGWKEWKAVLCGLTGDQGARRILSEHPENICLVSVDMEELLWDVDTEEDYRRVTEKIHGRDVPFEPI